MILIVHVAPAVRLLVHVFDSEKSETLVPANWILDIASEGFPVLDKVKVCGWLAVPRSWPA
jgi:hypothetical protein